MGGVVRGVSNAASSVKNTVENGVEAVRDTAEAVVDTVKDGASAAVETAKDAAEFSAERMGLEVLLHLIGLLAQIDPHPVHPLALQEANHVSQYRRAEEGQHPLAGALAQGSEFRAARCGQHDRLHAIYSL